MSRPDLARPSVTPAKAQDMKNFRSNKVDEVRAAVEGEDVVVVGMAWNPSVSRVRRTLDDAGVPFQYLEYGNYVSGWKNRLAIKLWSGWPTFPQVFVKGTFIGGNEDTRAALKDGSLRALLDGSPN
jgi:monothiol glutaredoxin